METVDSVPARAVLGLDGYRLCGVCGQELFTDELLHYDPDELPLPDPWKLTHEPDCYYVHDLDRESCEESNVRHTELTNT